MDLNGSKLKTINVIMENGSIYKVYLYLKIIIEKYYQCKRKKNHRVETARILRKWD